MSTHQHIDRICVVITLLALLLTILFMNGEALGLSAAGRVMGYEQTLFDPSRVHTIDIVIDDWDAFLDTAAGEDYTVCSLVIDNEAVKNVAIRGKGNTSLSTVAGMGSERYSFKLEFDHYEVGKTYKGLDKLCLNNLIQDNSYMKDYLAYRLMAGFGVDAPLCSYVWVTVNGEDWGLYLAVEAVEDSFLQRVYGGEGELYKPDSMSMGGGPGNGRDFDMDEFMNENADSMGFPRDRVSDRDDTEPTQSPTPQNRGGFPQPPSMPGAGGGFPGDFGMGSEDVKLQYSDDDPESYPNIFDNAKTELTDADKARLIRSLKALGEGETLEDVLDIDEVLRYFVVHNYLVNGDSYTGAMVHNYYLHEAGGRLRMIPWDYNLAFGTFRGGNASEAVNDPIDTPLSVSGDGTRPMADWIFQSETYTALYHQYFAEFLDSADIEALIDEAYALIAPYVEKDPTAFCSYEEFIKGVETLRSFCEKRTESVRGQLDGTIPGTDTGQQADPAALIETDGLALSDMGTMDTGKGGPDGEPFGKDGGFGQIPGNEASSGGGGPIPNGGEASSGGGEAPAAPEVDKKDRPDEPRSFSPDKPSAFPDNPESGETALSRPTVFLCALVLAGGLSTAALFKRRST